ncbi:cytochrome c oxidase subunit II [Pseudoxanthomonas sp. CAU 1598]|uniref:Cytochrome c oxidase subunit 2 n=2 Tax=Pseudomarimonas arenosa TaxID=2774145 RepID=A0AAW3ZKY0_9GAMM|nr:cytochrome c oxidase subunit II [Pseudomarimonas arenosa]MBD8525722.1 cytochrome c oxidase subunit II [Pseudomarimonas arenosa]
MKSAGKLGLWSLAVSAMLMAGAAIANPEPMQLNMTTGVTDVAGKVYDLHMLIFLICVAIGVVVFGAMVIAMIRFRKSKGAVAATWSHNTTAEVIWTVVPILILVGMAIPATKVLFEIDDVSGSEMTVKVTGYQWMWRYEILNYKDQPTSVQFVSRLDRESDRIRQLNSGEAPSLDGHPNYLLDVDKPLILPTDTKIRFVITADDVIHAWWVPSLGWKQDAIPGVINEAWTRINTPGTYRGQCAELCGKDHGFMPIVVKAVSRAEFETYLAGEMAARDDAARTAQTSVTVPAKG